MGKIIRNNIEYTGSSNSAGNISYDNSTSELQSQTVQNAITELKDLVDENTGNDVGRFEKDNQGNILGEIFNTYSGNDKNVASGNASHAEGNDTTASGNYSHAEGWGTTASEDGSHAEGIDTTASGVYSHAEGYHTVANGFSSHAEGGDTTASGIYSHAGGYETIATADYQTVIGKYNIADIIPEDSDTPVSFHLFIIGNGDGSNRSNIVEVTSDTFNVNGDITVAGNPLIVQCDTMPTADEHLLGHTVQYIGADGNYTHGWFYECISDGAEPPTYSWRELMDYVPTSGSNNPVTSEGIYKNTAGKKYYSWDYKLKGEIFNDYTHNEASGNYSHAEGYHTTASGPESHAEGSITKALNDLSHAEGYYTTASGVASHAEGYSTTASGEDSHAEGNDTTAQGNASHAEGDSTIASGLASHAGGYYTIANGNYQTVIGKYNIADGSGGSYSSGSSDSDSSDSDPPTPSSSQHLFIIGNGTDGSHRSNIVEVTSDTFNVNGDITVAGKPLIVQCETMSAADEYLLGRIVQYVGATDANYTHGCFYECVSDGKEPPTYSWQITKVIKFDNAPTSGSANAVTSDGIYKKTAGQKYYSNNTLKGEIFNNYTNNKATGNYSHAEGHYTQATGNYSHAEGYYTKATGDYSHAEGWSTTASGESSHAEGYVSTASGKLSRAMGEYTIASQRNMTAIGKYNSPRTGDLFNIGNGSSTTRSNILEANSTSVNINGDIQKNGISLPTPYTIMPTITASMLGQIAMYVGTTDANYTKGWFYITSSDGAAEPTYSWTPIVAHVEGLLPDNGNYTEFSNGVRLYVSDTEPTGTIPEGSLGVGW